eukprot:CAMPEP_0198733916 /NCGR_PEP_ID=MMETSP1475-20131203/49144_1 /TAXON_ID= ORGANISM="Unidentified sp., Strain CCMP1999" /NCGR_SAMPLE_ID=MMETSP1475 /ASSEMBLY_ACC=CAM_ASM_001111 /LENGTH=282 /DNA_ID=CAMNT_0044497289 /DNA_START=86 /DNA_END=931 /DNA_ORIENTATION=+
MVGRYGRTTLWHNGVRPSRSHLDEEPLVKVDKCLSHGSVSWGLGAEDGDFRLTNVKHEPDVDREGLKLVSDGNRTPQRVLTLFLHEPVALALEDVPHHGDGLDDGVPGVERHGVLVKVGELLLLPPRKHLKRPSNDDFFMGSAAVELCVEDDTSDHERHSMSPNPSSDVGTSHLTSGLVMIPLVLGVLSERVDDVRVMLLSSINVLSNGRIVPPSSSLLLPASTNSRSAHVRAILAAPFPSPLFAPPLLLALASGIPRSSKLGRSRPLSPMFRAPAAGARRP